MVDGGWVVGRRKEEEGFPAGASELILVGERGDFFGRHRLHGQLWRSTVAFCRVSAFSAFSAPPCA